MKIIIFEALLLLGVVNQLFLHPRIEALRASGDHHPLRVIFLLGLTSVLAGGAVAKEHVALRGAVLHGSARNQAYRLTPPSTPLVRRCPRLRRKRRLRRPGGEEQREAVMGQMVTGYRVSGRLAPPQSADSHEGTPGSIRLPIADPT